MGLAWAGNRHGSEAEGTVRGGCVGRSRIVPLFLSLLLLSHFPQYSRALQEGGVAGVVEGLALKGRRLPPLECLGVLQQRWRGMGGGMGWWRRRRRRRWWWCG